ncbi:MAG: T9SS type A sorting domain-containing protein, partial [Bacteroidota bacterium]
IFLSASASAQVYFNERFQYGQPDWSSGASSICQLADGYMLGGAYQNFCPHCVGFIRIDSLGNKIMTKTFCDDTTEYYLGNGGAIITLGPDSILAAGQISTQTTNWYHDRGILFFLNHDLDTLSTKQFGEKTEPFDTGYLFNQLILDSSKNIIITGSHYPNSPNARATMLLVKTDRYGNLIWKRRYGIGLHFEGRSVICTNDGGYAIGGYGYGVPIPPDYSGDPVVVKTDSAGNQQWLLNLGGQWQDTFAMICNSTDGNIIVGTTFCDSMPGGGPVADGNAYRRINIMKVDKSGNILWNKKYGISSMYNQLMSIRENSDGSLIACGFTTRLFLTTYDFAGWMLKTDPNGDSLWYRQYVICDGKTSWNWLFDVIPTNDNGFITGGIVYAHLPDPDPDDGWVLKVDSLGCENPSYCWVGMNGEKTTPSEVNLTVFPNPAEKNIEIKFNELNINTQFNLTMFDPFGRKIREVSIPPLETNIHIDISALPDGLYIIIARSGSKILAKTKLSINKKTTIL